MNLSDRYRTKTLDVLIYPGCKAIEAVATVHIFDSANAQLVKGGLPPVYDVKLASPTLGPIRTDTLLSLHAHKQMDVLAVPEIAIIVGARNIEAALTGNSDLVDWCQRAAPRMARTVGLCTGSFFLAEAGLLDNRRATTHWSAVELMQRRYPNVRVEQDAIYLKDDSVWTSAGVTACMDLALAMIEEDLGRDVALSVARDMVMYLKRPGGQSQFSVHLTSQMTENPTVRGIQEWMLAGLDRQFSIVELAAKAAMSQRNFARVFSRETGYGPAEFIEIARVELARRLLEEHSYSMKAVAVRCGFGTEVRFRKAFQRRCRVTPREYRERFSGTGVNALNEPELARLLDEDKSDHSPTALV